MNLRRPRRGFTLIELLVVITILGILAALLLPVFAKVRENGRMTTCTSNLHQLGLAIQMYEADNSGGLPPSFEYPRAIGKRYGLPPNWSFDPLHPYVTDPDIYYCPDGSHDLSTTYLYRVASLLSVDTDQPQETPGKMIKPEPNTVLVLCMDHLTNPYSPTQRQGSYLALRSSGSVSRVGAQKVSQWMYHAGHWYPPGSPPILNASFWEVFPDEPWPPQFEK